MSLELSPAPALAQNANYQGDGGFSFLYPLQIIRTDDATLVGDGTTHPCGLTLTELIFFTFHLKTLQFTASPAWAGSWEFLPNALSIDALQMEVIAQTDGAIYPPGTWYSGNFAGYAAALSSRKLEERQLARGLNPAWIVRIQKAGAAFELRYLYSDIFGASGSEDFSVYQLGGLYYPAIIAHFIQPNAELLSYKIPGGSGLIVDSDDPSYTLYGGYVSFLGHEIKIGDLGLAGPGSPPFFKDPTTMSVSAGENFNQGGG